MKPENKTHSSSQQIANRARWYVNVRWLIILGLGLPAILTEYVSQGVSSRFIQYLLVTSGGLAYNLVFFLLTRLKRRSLRYYQLTAVLQVLSDILLSSYLLIANGGIESRTVIVYVLPIIMAGAIFKRRAVIAVALVSVLVYDSLIWLDFQGIIRPLNIRNPAVHQDPSFLILTLTFYSVALVIVATVVQFVLKLMLDEELRANRQNEALVELTQRDQALFYSIGDSIIVTDEYGRITRVNSELENLTGYNEAELKDQPLNSVIPLQTMDGKPVPPDKRVVFEALTTGKPTHGSYRIVRKDSTSFVGDMTASPYVIKDRPAGAVVTIRDISQQFAIDKAKTEFVSLASHQLRTPLSTINWYLEMVIGGDVGKISKQQEEYLNEVYAANQRMVALVNALLNVSRIDLGTFAIEPSPTDLKKVVSNVLTELRSQIQTKKMKIDTDYDAGLKPYNADPKLVHIIFQNLISNAVKYTPAKGKITIGLNYDKADFVISVADNGYGIPKAQQSKIFTKLFRADNVLTKETDGTGLGLYLVKAIIEEAGGKISFKSKENSGTTFSVRLPLGGMKKRVGTKGLTTAPIGGQG